MFFLHTPTLCRRKVVNFVKEFKMLKLEIPFTSWNIENGRKITGNKNLQLMVPNSEVRAILQFSHSEFVYEISYFAAV